MARQKKSLVRAKDKGLPVQAHREHRSKNGRKRNMKDIKKNRKFRKEYEEKYYDYELKYAKTLYKNKTFKI